MRGILIVFEGLDRTGKSTQVKHLKSYLEKVGIKVKNMRFPERSTNIGKMISQFLSNASDMEDEALHLLFSANRWELKNNMVEDLNNGYTLIVDRYAYSGIAYSNAKGVDFEWCKQCDKGN